MTYNLVDTQTRKLIKSYASLRAAALRCEYMNFRYGATRYTVNGIAY